MFLSITKCRSSNRAQLPRFASVVPCETDGMHAAIRHQPHSVADSNGTPATLEPHQRRCVQRDAMALITTVTPEIHSSRAHRIGQFEIGTRGNFCSRQACIQPDCAHESEDKCPSRAASGATRKRREALDAQRPWVSTDRVRQAPCPASIAGANRRRSRYLPLTCPIIASMLARPLRSRPWQYPRSAIRLRRRIPRWLSSGRLPGIADKPAGTRCRTMMSRLPC